MSIWSHTGAPAPAQWWNAPQLSASNFLLRSGFWQPGFFHQFILQNSFAQGGPTLNRLESKHHNMRFLTQVGTELGKLMNVKRNQLTILDKGANYIAKTKLMHNSASASLTLWPPKTAPTKELTGKGQRKWLINDCIKMKFHLSENILNKSKRQTIK